MISTGEGGFKKDANATLQDESKKKAFALWLVPDVWKQLEKPQNTEAEVEFSHKDSEAYAMVIAERIQIPIRTLRKVFLENLTKKQQGCKLFGKRVGS